MKLYLLHLIQSWSIAPRTRYPFVGGEPIGPGMGTDASFAAIEAVCFIIGDTCASPMD